MNVRGARKFAFIIHPRTIFDFYQRFPFLKLVPKIVLEQIIKYLPAVHVSYIKGLKDTNGEKIKGEILSITLTAKQMLNNKALAKKHIVKAIEKASRKGCTHIGLGAFTSVVTSGGEDLRKLVPGVHITNGNALTAYVSYISIVELIKEFGDTKPSIAVIGASGSIGSAVTELLTKHGSFEALYLIGKTPANIERLLEKISSFLHFSKVQHLSLNEVLPKADIIIAATSADGAVITPELLKKNAIVYDITQPKNIPSDILKRRPDVTVFDGGLINLPKGVSINYNLGVPKNTTFSCLGETMLMSLANFPDDFSLGKVTCDQVEFIEKLAKQFEFSPAKKVSWKSSV